MVNQSRQTLLLMLSAPLLFVVLVLLLSGSNTIYVHGAIAFNASNFHNPLTIDNKYLPLKPGTTMISKGTSEGDPTRDVAVVSNETKEVNGISTRVVHDDGYVKGKHEVTTDDWYAQDDSGNVWYMGEYTTDLTSKKNPHEGSWEAGVKGAEAGIVMEADPKVGDSYNQEFSKDIAEDKATVLSLNDKLSVPYGSFTNVLKTKDFSPLEPDIVENKYYAPNVGEIKAINVKGDQEVETLVQVNRTGNNNTDLPSPK